MNGPEKESTVTQSPLSATHSPRKALETYLPPPVEEELEEEEEEATPPKPSPTESWLERDIVLVDCFNEVVDRKRLDQADLIGVRVYGWV